MQLLLRPGGGGGGGLKLNLSSLAMIGLHTKNQLPSLPGSSLKVCVVGGWLRVNLVLCFGPNHDFRFAFRLGPS